MDIGRACQAEVVRYSRQSPHHKPDAYREQCARRAVDGDVFCKQHAAMAKRGLWVVRVGDMPPAFIRRGDINR